MIEEREDAELGKIYPSVVEIYRSISHLDSVNIRSGDQQLSEHVPSSTALWDDRGRLDPEHHTRFGS